MLLDASNTDSAIAQSHEHHSIDSPAIRAQILALQADMLKLEEKIECPVTHTFAPGVYAREMRIPKGTLIVGKIHKHAHVNIVSKGSAQVMTEFGPMQIDAPHTFVSQPGTKRVVLALEDVIWTTIHPTNETDLAKIEEEVIAKSYDELSLGGPEVSNALGEIK